MFSKMMMSKKEGQKQILKKLDKQQQGSLIHERIMDLTQLLHKDNNKFLSSSPTESIFLQIIDHIYNCYDQLDHIFKDQLKDIPLLIQQKIIRDNYHKLFSVNKHLFKSIGNWFQRQKFLGYKSLNNKNANKGQIYDYANLCDLCLGNREQIRIKEAKMQILGGFQMKMNFQKDLEFKKMQQQIQAQAYARSALEDNNSVKFLSKMISEMQKSGQSYFLMAQNLQSVDQFQQQQSIKSITDSLQKIMNKLSQQCRKKLILKLKNLAKFQENIINNTHKKQKLSIVQEVNESIIGSKSKKILDAQQLSIRKITQQKRVLEIQYNDMSCMCEFFKQQLLKLGYDMINKEKQIKNLLDNNNSNLENVVQKKYLIPVLSSYSSYKQNPRQSHQEAKIQEKVQQKQLITQSITEISDERQSKKRKLKQTGVKKTYNNNKKADYSNNQNSNNETDFNMDSQISLACNDDQKQQNISTFNQKQQQQQIDISSRILQQSDQEEKRDTVVDKQQITQQKQVPAFKRRKTKRTSGFFVLNEANKESSNKNAQNNLIILKIDFGTQYEPVLFQKKSQNKLKSKLKLQDVKNTKYVTTNMKKSNNLLQSVGKLNKTFNIHGKLTRFNTQVNQQNSNQISKQIRTLKNIEDRAQEDTQLTKEKNNVGKEKTQRMITITHIQCNIHGKPIDNRINLPVQQFKFSDEKENNDQSHILEKVNIDFNKYIKDKNNQKKYRFSTEGNASCSIFKKSRSIRNILFKPKHLLLFGGVSESFAYQNIKIKQKQVVLTAKESSYFNQIYLFILNLKQFRMSIYENVVLFLTKPYDLIDKNQNVYKDIGNNTLKNQILKFIYFNQGKSKNQGNILNQNLLNFGKIIGFQFTH